MSHRIAIAGGPRTGKTTLAAFLAPLHGITARSTDELVGEVPYADAAKQVAGWLDSLSPYVIEGVTVVRALRAWLRAHEKGAPCDVVYWSDTPKTEQTPGQATMAKGCATVWAQIEAELRARGVVVQRF